MSRQDIMFSTGGDMLCYKDNMVNTTNHIAHERGIKTVLWGASMGKENLAPAKMESLQKFSLVYARESLSYDFFKSIGLKNVVCLPDPAFVLEPVKTELPDCFKEHDVIGINLSNYILGGFDLKSNQFGGQVKKTLDFLLANTSMSILLIPHVLWSGQDDRIVADNIQEAYKSTGRFSVLNTSKLNYLQIRYIISKCKLFIGARTHAVISAYSGCVPTLALGYSIKSLGIARDIGLEQKLVVDSRNAGGSLVENVKYLLNNYDVIKGNMESIMPDYRTMPFQAKALIDNLI